MTDEQQDEQQDEQPQGVTVADLRVRRTPGFTGPADPDDLPRLRMLRHAGHVTVTAKNRGPVTDGDLVRLMEDA